MNEMKARIVQNNPKHPLEFLTSAIAHFQRVSKHFSFNFNERCRLNKMKLFSFYEFAFFFLFWRIATDNTAKSIELR